MAERLVQKTIKGSLVGLNGNAYNLMGYFQKEARRQGWEKEEIDKVLNECKSSDYNHLVATLLEYIEEEE